MSRRAAVVHPRGCTTLVLADDPDHQGAGRRQIPAEDWDRFVAEFRGYRYDAVCDAYYPYEQVLQNAFDRVCRKWRIESDPTAGKRLAEGVRSWGPHPDVVEPLKKMGEHYKLVILSNADASFLEESVPRLEAKFHAVFTADQAGSYKPRYGAFEYMLEQLDAKPEDFVHVSSHTRYDPCRCTTWASATWCCSTAATTRCRPATASPWSSRSTSSTRCSASEPSR